MPHAWAAAVAAAGVRPAQHAQGGPIAAFDLSDGRAEIHAHFESIDPQLWSQAFASSAKDHRYYQVIEQTLHDAFEHYYLVLSDRDGRGRAVQPLFLIHQDLAAAAGGRVRALIESVRRFSPGFLRMKMLMVGCVAGEGRLEGGEGAAWTAQRLHEALACCARHFRTSIIALKDFSSEYRRVLQPFSRNGYFRISSMPATRLDLNFSTFEEYLKKVVSKKTRKNLRQKFKKAEPEEIRMEVVHDVRAHIDEIYPLYLNVYHRSPYKFEKLTKAYFCGLAEAMPDRARFFIWRRAGKIVAFSLCLVHDGTLYDEYIGLDYGVALDLHLYFRTWRDVIQWAIDHGIKRYYSSPLNYEPKLHLRCELAPLDLYITHTRSMIRPIFRRLIFLMQPTRHQKVLKKFRNFEALS